jgi:hypothetical protein
MARTPRTIRKKAAAARRRLPLNEEPAHELSFDSDERSARIGDPMDPQELRRAMPLRREREAGLTGGEIPGRPGDHVTGDDLSPETLLDADGSGTPAAYSMRAPMETMLRVVDESEIGEGFGKDEAELAQEDPVADEAVDTNRRAHRTAPHP